MGNGDIIHAGEWQVMTAGTGLTHSEFNPSDTEPVHLLQIWIFPEKKGLTPSYGQRLFTEAEKAGKWRLVASPTAEDGSLPIHQDAHVYQTKLVAGQSVSHELKPGRAAFLHVATGAVTLNGTRLTAGDGVAIENEASLRVTGDELAEVLLFDLK
jgi:redox-sensitive bicupin YhaK (pirin superfamily)